MNAGEYANLDAVERTHWYYAGKRAMVRWWLDRVGPPQPSQVLLDCGAGTGRFALEMEAQCRVLVLDDHEEALRLLRSRFKAEQILSLSGDAVPLPDGSLDYVTALDVLEHVPDDVAVVRGFRRLLKAGGCCVVTVPASMALWSDWDEGLHHYRRYDRAQLSALFPSDHWEIIHVNYTNVVIYPAVWLVRKWRRLARRSVPASASPAARSEDKLPPAWLNSLLQSVFVGLAKVRVPFPFGVSLLLVARRRA
jgi:SAM-dependent methyltransferase